MTGPTLYAFRAKFRLAELEVARPAGWVLSVRPGQLTLGAMVLTVESGVQELAAMDAAAGAGLAEGLSLAERLAREVYGAVRINALCLMMQDPVVHFHILPRYDRPVERHGRIWQDTDWPGPPSIRPVNDEAAVLWAVRDELRQVL